MIALTDTDLYLRGAETLLASWEEYARGVRGDLELRGYTLDTSTRAMGVALEDLRTPPSELDLRTLEWSDYLRIFGLPPGLLA